MKDDTPFDWGEHDLDRREISLALGPLELHFAREAGEIRIAHRRTGDPHPLRWTRWVPTGEWDGRIALHPALPDRPVVVRPENEFWLLKGAQARIYVRIPLHVRIDALGPSPRTLLRLPTAVLSDTWWGTPEEGELCYFLDTKARRAMRDEEFLEHVVVCPLELVNGSSDELLVNRIALRTEYLGIYRDGTRLWSDETRVRYRGDDEESSLSVAGAPPRETEGAERIEPPDEEMVRGFTARTFARLRSSLGWS